MRIIGMIKHGFSFFLTRFSEGFSHELDGEGGILITHALLPPSRRFSSAALA